MTKKYLSKLAFQKGCYQDLPIPSSYKKIIANPTIKVVSLTGSEQAGIAVATEAGKHLKKCVLELGGSNAFIILEDANLEKQLQQPWMPECKMQVKVALQRNDF